MFRRHGDPAPLALTLLLLRRGRGGARRHRRGTPASPRGARLLPGRCPTTRSSSRPASTRRRSSAVLDGDLATAERCYRAAADGFARVDRPMMLAMCLGMVADFDERAGDHRAAIAALDAGDRAQRHARACAGSTAPCSRGSAGPCSTTATRRAAELAYPAAARPRPTRSATGPSIFLALTGLAVVRRLDGRDRRRRRRRRRSARAAPRRRSPPARQPRRSRSRRRSPRPPRAARCSAASPPTPAAPSRPPSCSGTPHTCAPRPAFRAAVPLRRRRPSHRSGHRRSSGADGVRSGGSVAVRTVDWALTWHFQL